MEYRKLPHGNEKISVLGMGTSVVGEASEKNVVETITYAPVLANKVLDMGLIDMMMFSINPMYDFGQGDFSIGSSSERYSLYSIMQGAANVEHLKQNLAFLDATEEEKDYSVISSLTPDDTKGKCVYCKHCHPCPAGIDIGLVNKYYDLAKLGDVLAKEHFLTLEKNASVCLQCGHCNKRCPFSVDQMSRMKEIEEYFRN